MLSSIPFQSCPVILNVIEFTVILGIEDGFMTSLENNGLKHRLLVLKVIFRFKNSQRTAAFPISYRRSAVLASYCSILSSNRRSLKRISRLTFFCRPHCFFKESFHRTSFLKNTFHTLRSTNLLNWKWNICSKRVTVFRLKNYALKGRLHRDE